MNNRYLFTFIIKTGKIHCTSVHSGEEIRRIVNPTTRDIGFNPDLINRDCYPLIQSSQLIQSGQPFAPLNCDRLNCDRLNCDAFDDIPQADRLKYISSNSPSKTKYHNGMVHVIKMITSELSENMPDLGAYESKYIEYLKNKNIVIILDNSQSMTQKSDEKNFLQDMGITNYKTLNRHQEMSAILLFMLQALKKSGVESVHVEFLNNGKTLEGKNFKEIQVNFKDDSIHELYDALTVEPLGFTPLTTTIERSVKKYDNSEIPTHFVVFTDGLPYFPGYDPEQKNTVEGLKRCLKKYFSSKKQSGLMKVCSCIKSLDVQSRRTINFIACTGDEDDVGYLNDLDRKSSNIDVISDYYNELQQISSCLKFKGLISERFPMKMNAYIYKALVGSLDPEADALDEQK